MYAGLIILGFGGHARSIADVALANGVTALLFVDANARDGEQFLGFEVQREYRGVVPEGWACMPAAGENRRRQAQVQAISRAGWPLATLISKTATIGAGAVVSDGCFVAHHAHVGPMSRIGTGCILNTGAIVDHDSTVGDYVHISVNTTVAGNCRVGDFVFLGAGATLIDGGVIANDVTVGVGGAVIAPIDQPGTYVGVPVRRITPPGE